MTFPKMPLLVAVFLAAIAPSAHAQTVTTIAGTGASGYSGDGGPALTAQLQGPQGIAVAPNGAVYFADTNNFRIRKISPAGIITTVAGTGIFGYDPDGDTGDGGPATSAGITSVFSVALNPAGTVLYFADFENNRIRQVNLTTGIITEFAGQGVSGFGFSGDGGPATLADLAAPVGVAVDSVGNVYITDSFNNRIRRVDAGTGVITTFAGNGDFVSAGDGGLATAASFEYPYTMAVDSADNVFVLDLASANVVRRIDSVTRIITRVAGGGATIPGVGPATTMNINGAIFLATDAAGQLFIGADGRNQIYKVDLASGLLSVFAGTGVPDFSGDGGPAIAATFRDIFGLAFKPTGELLLSDSGNSRIRSIAPPTPFDVVITLTTSQGFLDLLTAVGNDLVMVNVDGRDFLIIPNLASVGLDVTVADNDALVIVDLSALESAGGHITFTGNLALTSIDLSALTGVGGSLIVSGNPLLNALLVSGITSIEGDLTLIGSALTVINLPNLTEVGGSVSMDGDTSLTSIDLGSLDSVGGSVSIDGDTSLTSIDLGSLDSVGGSVSIDGDTSLTSIDLGSLGSVGGSVSVDGDTSLTTIDLGSLTTAGGSVSVDGDTSLVSIDLGSLDTVGGSVSVDGDTSLVTIDLGSLDTVGGSVSVDGDTSLVTIDLGSLTTAGGSVSVDGDTSLVTIGLGSLDTVGGSVSIDGDTSLTSIDLGSLGSVGGSVSMDGDTSVTSIDLGALTSVGGSVSMDGDTSVTSIDLGSLDTVGGSVSMDGDTSVTSIDLGALTSVGGSVSMDGDTSVTSIDLGSLGSTGGSVSMTGDTSVTSIDLSSLGSVAGDLSVEDNGPCTAVTLGTLTSVTGNISVESCGTGTFATGGVIVGGNTDLATNGFTTVNGTTATGATSVTNTQVEAAMTVHISVASFVTPVTFSLTRLAPAALPPESGLAVGGGAATVDPVAAYAFTFAVPTLNRDANLSFDVQVAGLDAATRTDFLAALAAGKATMATKSGSGAYQAFPLCTGSGVPTAGGCVRVDRLDANGLPTAGTPAIVRFTNVVGHFSTWAVAIVTPTSTPARSLTALGPARFWVGVMNSDAVGTRFDLKAEVSVAGALVGSGQLNGVIGGSSGFAGAKLNTIPLSLPAPVEVGGGAVLSIKLLARIACSGNTHASGTARLWLNDAQANSRFDATIGDASASYYLRNGFALGTSAGPGPKGTVDLPLDSKIKCADRPFKSFGTWSLTLP